MSETNPFEPMSDAPEGDEATTDERPEYNEPEKSEDSVPDGSTREVLAWVDDDPEKAQKALDAENDKPEDDRRKGLVRSLTSLLS